MWDPDDTVKDIRGILIAIGIVCFLIMISVIISIRKQETIIKHQDKQIEILQNINTNLTIYLTPKGKTVKIFEKGP